MTETKEKKYKCHICGESDWTDLDYLRVLPNKFAMCNSCGFVTYLKTQEKISKGYENHSHNPNRKFAGSSDLQTKNAKLVQHRFLLKKYLEKLPKNASILDYGCSTGYILNMIKEEYGIKDVQGMELNDAHAEFGRQEYGLNIYHAEKISDVEKFKDKKFDLIINFAVLEHIIDPVSALKEMKSFLKEDGTIYLMTPIWLDTLYNSEHKITNFESLFVPEHVNCFTYLSRENVFRLAKMEAVERNDSMYGSIAFLKNSKEDLAIVKENPKDIQKKISDTKQAIFEMFQANYDVALALWPKNPDAIISLSTKRNKGNMAQHSQELKRALEIMPNNPHTIEIIGSFNFQNQALSDAETFFKKAIEFNPRMYKSYWSLHEIEYLKGNYKKAVDYIQQIIDINPDMMHAKFNNDTDSVLDRKGKIYAKMVSK